MIALCMRKAERGRRSRCRLFGWIRDLMPTVLAVSWTDSRWGKPNQSSRLARRGNHVRVSASGRIPDDSLESRSSAGDPTDREGRDALEQLCRDYWYPLYAFARRQGLDREEAGDLVQGFLADLIERGDLAKADPTRGRFRSFLRTACSHFLSHARDHDRALKRGGGRSSGLDRRARRRRTLHQRAGPRYDGRTSL